MLEPLAVAGILLVFGPLLGAVPVAYPPLLSIWTASREDHIRTVAAHRTGWRTLNAGFFFATVTTTAGLGACAVAVAATSPGDPGWAALLAAATLAYGIAGTLWCAVLAIRSITIPTLFDLGAPDAPAGEAERLMGAVSGGLFAAFVLATAVTLVLLGAGMALSGTVAAPLARWR